MFGVVVEITLTNTEAWVTDCSDKAFAFLRDYWSFFPPGYRFAPTHTMWLRAHANAVKRGETDFSHLPGWDGRIRYYKKGSVPAGLFRATQKDLEEKGFRFKLSYDMPALPKLRLGLPKATLQYSYQDICADAMCANIKNGGGIILAGTGTGKTSTAARFMARVSCNCLFVVNTIDLLYQAQEDLAKWLGEPVGIIGNSECDFKRVTVGSVQTLAKRLKTDFRFALWYASVQIVIVDELHEQMNRSNFKVLENTKPIARYGLTATLQLTRKDIRLRAYAFAGPVIFTFPLSEGVKQKVLTKGSALQLLFPEDDMAQAVDYQEQYAIEVVDNEVKKNAVKAIATYLHAQKKYVIILVERVKHVKELAALLKPIPLRTAYGAISRENRVTARAKFEEGKVRLLIANKVFKKGIDLKRVDCIIDMAEMKSKNDAQQKYGRGVRLHPNKDSLLYIDFGTQDKGRMGKAASSRSRALKALGVETTKVKVSNVAQALKAVTKYLKQHDKVGSQMKLELSA